jgi:hypothetical protein
MIPKPKKMISRLPSWVRLIVSYLYNVGLFSIGGAVVLLIVVTFKGDLFSKNGLFLILYVLVFLILLFLKKTFEKDDEV